VKEHFPKLGHDPLRSRLLVGQLNLKALLLLMHEDNGALVLDIQIAGRPSFSESSLAVMAFIPLLPFWPSQQNPYPRSGAFQ
jgi:hypothetical protein